MHRLKKITGLALAILASLALLAWIIPALFEDRVKNLVVSSLNERLRAVVQAGGISLSVFPAFPYATVTITDVIVKEPKDFQTTGTVMTASKVALHFNLASIFSNSYRLKKIQISDATFNLQTSASGATNFEIWKKDSTEGAADDFRIELHEVLFERVGVLYYHVPKSQDFSFFIRQGSLYGDFSQTRYALSAEGLLEHASVTVDGVGYLKEKKGALGLALDVNTESGLYTFSDSWVKLEGLKLGITGDIRDAGKALDLNLRLSSPGAGLKELLSLVPAKYLPPIHEYKYTGHVTFTGTVKGISDALRTPHMHFAFSCDDVTLKPPGSSHELKRLRCRGEFTNRKNNSNPVNWLRIDNLSATLDGKPLTADLEVENFKRPRLAVRASLDADLSAFAIFFLSDTLEQVSGTVSIDARFNGIAGQKNTYRSSGDITLRNAAFRVKHKPLRFEQCNGELHLDNNDLIIRNAEGKAGSSDFRFNGTFENLFGWMLDEGQNLQVQAAFHSNDLLLDEWMATVRSGQSSTDTSYRLKLSPGLGLNLTLEVEKFTFRKFQATGIRGEVSLRDRVFLAKNLALNTVGGQVLMNGSIDNRSSDSLEIRCDADIKNLDIRQLFYEMGNFGQEVITDRHLKGRVTAQVRFLSDWSNRLDINENSIYSVASITIENGELIRFEPMLALSRYLKGSDLQTIRFSTLTNTVEIKDRKIWIPRMEIKSSAADITASGQHTFDNMVDYKLQLYLSQILGRKVKAQNTEFGTIEDDGLGRPMLYLTMKGSAADPKFTWDRQGVEKKITTEISKEAKSLKQVFREEFGKKDSSATRPATGKKKEELQIDYEEDGE
jgi:hypothetical protein